jgi:hypothetical protein
VDEWVRASVSGLLGGGLVAALTWYKIRDEQLGRRRSLLLDVYAAADAFYNARTLDPKAEDSWDMFGALSRSRAALMLVETDPEILAKLKQLEDAVIAIFKLAGPVKDQQELEEKVLAPRKELRRCMRELLEAARKAFRTASG